MCSDNLKCKICAATSHVLGRTLILGKYSIHYFRCEQCGFIQTEPPYWLAEAYASAMTRSDLGLARRNVICARYVPAIISAFFNRQGRFLDYGGGYGLFVRLMRDQGYDFFRLEKFAQNLFAVGFDVADCASTQYELLTAFEVFEHLTDPLEEITQMLAYSRSILFSTRLVPSPPPDLDSWWYYGTEHGQHVSLFTYQSLIQMAKMLGLHVYSNGRSVHLLTDKKLLNTMFVAAWLVGRFMPGLDLLSPGPLGQHSLAARDYYNLTGKRLD